MQEWDLTERNLKKNYGRVHGGSISGMRMTPDGLFLFTIGFFDKTMKQWSTEKHLVIKTFGVIHDQFLTAIAITPTGDLVYTGDDKGN